MEWENLFEVVGALVLPIVVVTVKSVASKLSALIEAKLHNELIRKVYKFVETEVMAAEQEISLKLKEYQADGKITKEEIEDFKKFMKAQVMVRVGAYIKTLPEALGKTIEGHVGSLIESQVLKLGIEKKKLI